MPSNAFEWLNVKFIANWCLIGCMYTLMCFVEHHLDIVWGICSYSIPLNFKQTLLNLTKGMIQADQKLNSVKGYFVEDLRAQATQPKHKCICLKKYIQALIFCL